MADPSGSPLPKGISFAPVKVTLKVADAPQALNARSRRPNATTHWPILPIATSHESRSPQSRNEPAQEDRARSRGAATQRGVRIFPKNWVGREKVSGIPLGPYNAR